jgi:hypothetical protein
MQKNTSADAAELTRCPNSEHPNFKQSTRSISDFSDLLRDIKRTSSNKNSERETRVCKSFGSSGIYVSQIILPSLRPHGVVLCCRFMSLNLNFGCNRTHQSGNGALWRKPLLNCATEPDGSDSLSLFGLAQ